MVAQISLSDTPCCEFINDIPQWFFLLVHVAIFLVAVVMASRGFGSGSRALGWGFTFFALAEVFYLTYHVNLTLFLFAHTIAEVLVLLGIISLGRAAIQRGANTGTRA